jgi:hypothetical protein
VTADTQFRVDNLFRRVEPRSPRQDPSRNDSERREHQMKIALLALFGLLLGMLCGAALGIGAGLAWVEIFKTTGFEGYSGMLVFFTFMPLGAGIGGIGGAILFAVMAAREAEIASDRRLGRENET